MPASTKPAPETTKDIQRLTRKLTNRVVPLVQQRLAALAAEGIDLQHIDLHTDQLADAMLQALPSPPASSTPTSHAQVSGPVWSTEQVRKALGADGKSITRQAVADRIQRNTLLGLQVKERGERAYPLWQFVKHDGTWTVMPGLAAILQAVPESVLDRWTLASWLQQPHPTLRDKTPLEALKAGRHEDVTVAAKALAERWSH